MKKAGLIFLSICILLLSAPLMASAEVHITVAQGADAVTLDPHGENDQPSSRVRTNIYDTLVFQNEDLELEPGLATDWEHVDELVWEFTLRDDVYFHNGEHFTASDVKFTLERLADPDMASPGAFIVGFWMR